MPTQAGDSMRIPNWIIQGSLSVVIGIIGWGLKDTVEQLRAVKAELVESRTQIAVLKTESLAPHEPPAWFVRRMDVVEMKLDAIDQRLRNVEAGRHADAVGHGGPVLGFDAGQ